MSPTQRTLAYYRKKGFPVDVTERWIPRANIRKDLFGIIDLIILDIQAPRIIGVQTTSGSNHAARIKKALDSDILRAWLICGGRFFVVSWRKLVARKKDGSKAKLPRWAGRSSHVELRGEVKTDFTVTEAELN